MTRLKEKHAERGSRLRHNLDRYIGCFLIGILGLLRVRRSGPPAQLRSIGLIMFGAIGDTLLAASVLQDLRNAYPAADVTAFVSNSNKTTLELLAGFDRVIVVPIMKPTVAVRLMRRYPLDLLIDTSQWARIGALLASLARARYTVGFRTPGQARHFAFDVTALHSAGQHELENFRGLLKAIGISGGSLPRFAPELLAAIAAPTPARPYVVLHPWASGYRSEMREWNTRRWVELGRLVLKWGYEIVITGGPEDAARADLLAQELGSDSRIRVLAGRANLRMSAVAVGRAAAVVAVNTGIMHLATLLNVPMVALHGPTNPQRWGPIGTASIVIGPGPECGCGFLNLGFEYPNPTPACMDYIEVSEVARPLQAMLARPVQVAL